MKKVLLPLLLILCFTTSAYAKNETFGISTFQTPAGWKKDTKQGVVSLSKISGNGIWLLEGAF